MQSWIRWGQIKKAVEQVFTSKPSYTPTINYDSLKDPKPVVTALSVWGVISYVAPLPWTPWTLLGIMTYRHLQYLSVNSWKNNYALDWPYAIKINVFMPIDRRDCFETRFQFMSCGWQGSGSPEWQPVVKDLCSSSQHQSRSPVRVCAGPGKRYNSTCLIFCKTRRVPQAL